MEAPVKTRPWEGHGEEKGRSVRRMFAEIAGSYDLLNDLMSLAGHRRWRRAAVAHLDLRPGESVLDVCCGTGDFLAPIRASVGPAGRVVGVDFCAPMLALAAAKPGHAAGLELGDACRLPVASGAFDAVTVGWGLRNVTDRAAALAEALRALRPGGRFVCLDMAGGDGRAWSDRAFRRVVPLIGRAFGKAEAYTYLPESATGFPEPEALAGEMRAAGFVEVGHRRLFFGTVAMHWGVKP